MSQSRPQNSLSNEHEQQQISENEASQESQLSPNKASSRPPGRPRGRGRPKLTQRAINKKKNSQQQYDEDVPKTKERANTVKQENQIQAYVRIIDFLRKIDCDQASFQNKMNPYHCLTANCFWYMISAENYSYDFFIRNNPLDAANHVLNRVGKLPLQMPTRFIKNTHQGAPLEFQTEQVKRYGQQLSEHLAHLIPSSLASGKFENLEKKLSLTTVPEDNQFITSTRALLFNYIKGKIQKSQKWSAGLKGRLQIINDLEPKQITRRGPIYFERNRQQIFDASQLDILSRQVKKNKNQKKKCQKGSEPVILNNNEQDQQKPESQESQHVKSLNERIQENIELQKQSMDDEKQNEDQKNSNNSKDRNNSAQESNDVQSQAVKRISKQMTSDQVLLSGILNLPLQKVITILESTLPKIQLPQINRTFMPIPRNDPLDFIFQLHEEEQNYLEYMKQYQKKVYHQKIKKCENMIEQEQRQIQFEDAKCQICTDGDYTDDNLIVFCSTCNISLHQRCVGLAKVPAQSWVCDVCLAFGPGGINVPCPLCNVKGGAMKRTNIHIDSNLFKETNPGYVQYSKKCPYNKQKEQYPHAPKIEHLSQINDQNQQNQEKQDKQELFYDYFNKNSYPNDQPVCHYVWVHYVCSIWVPECYFEQKNGAINVKGIENIQKRRFKHQCCVCKRVKAGACVKCEDPQCKKYYHPQCARKKKVYMEQLNLQKIKYLIFCEQHQPLKITRQIEYKKKKSRDEIIKFARMIEKYVQTYKIAYFPFKLMKIIPTKSFIQTFECEQKEEEPQKKPQVIKQTDEDFIKQIIMKLIKVKKISVTVIKTQTGIKISDVYQPSRRQMRKCLNKYDDFWHTLQNGENAEQNCKRYDRIIKQNIFLKDKMEIFLNGGSLGGSRKPAANVSQKNKKAKSRNKRSKQVVQTLIEQEGGIFCICRKPYENQLDMFECQICGQWYHYKCIGFNGTQDDAQGLEFHCMKCMKFQTQEQKRPRLQKCIHLFSSDSLYLNYSPPTPKLMSEEEQHQLKQPFELQGEVPQSESNNQASPQMEQQKVQSHEEFKQNKKVNILQSQEDLNKSGDLPLASLPLKQGRKSNKSEKSQVSVRSAQKAKTTVLIDANNGTVTKIHQINNKMCEPNKTQHNRMQTTITQFLGISAKKDGKNRQQNFKQKEQTSQGKKILSNAANLSMKQKLAKLQRSVIDGEYNGKK